MTSPSGSPAGAGAGGNTNPKEAYTTALTVRPHVLANPLAWTLWGLDFAVWVASLIGPAKWVHNLYARNQQVSRVIGVAERVNVVANGSDPLYLIPGEESVRTVHDLMQRNFMKFANVKAFGTRRCLGEHKPAGSRFPLKLFGETDWLTYSQVGARARDLGAGLYHLGLRPQPAGAVFDTLDGPHSLLIWEDTSPEFMTALIAAGGQSIAVATSYATLGFSAVAEAVNQGQVRVVLANYHQIDNLVKLKAKCPSLTHIIVSYFNCEPALLAKPLPDTKASGVTLIAYENVVELGRKNPVPYHAPRPDTISVVMYTSGSTGSPKGVVIKHESFVASVAALVFWMRANADLQEGGEAYCAYLPAAHILELVAEHAVMSIGAEIGFADPRTITSRGACRQRPDGTINTDPVWPYPPGALQEFRPTLLAGVPKIWDIFKKAVEQKVGHSALMRFALDVAYPARALALSQGRETPLFKLLFKKIASVVGGRLKLGLTGGGPCSSDVQTFVRTCFAIPFIQGYALTETCCAGCIQYLADPRNGVVGPPFASVRIRLHDAPEVLDAERKPYLSRDTSHLGTPCAGRGEVWISGVSVSVGYFKEPEKTAEAFVEFEGRRWFKTGDIGIWTPDGCLRIVDRAKNLVKLAGGEYIAIEHMEATYGTNGIVDALNGGIMCYGDGELDRPVAFVQIVGKQLEEWARCNSIAYDSVEALCENPRAEVYVTELLNGTGKQAGLQAIELLGGVKLFAGTGQKDRAGGNPHRHDPWTPDNGGLTATSKINRKVLQGFFPKELAQARTKYGIRG